MSRASMCLSGAGSRRAALHEIYPTGGLKDSAAAAGFGLGLALRAGEGRPLVWVRQDLVGSELGWLHGAGLAAFGADPDHVLVVRAADQTEGLRAAREALRCSALGAVLLEVSGTRRALDLTATRRLALAASQHGVPLVMIRLGAAPGPKRRHDPLVGRYSRVRPSRGECPGRPAFALTLLRHRAGISGQEPGMWSGTVTRASFSGPSAATLALWFPFMPSERLERIAKRAGAWPG